MVLVDPRIRPRWCLATPGLERNRRPIASASWELKSTKGQEKPELPLPTWRSLGPDCVRVPEVHMTTEVTGQAFEILQSSQFFPERPISQTCLIYRDALVNFPRHEQNGYCPMQKPLYCTHHLQRCRASTPKPVAWLSGP